VQRKITSGTHFCFFYCFADQTKEEQTSYQQTNKDQCSDPILLLVTHALTHNNNACTQLCPRGKTNRDAACVQSIDKVFVSTFCTIQRAWSVAPTQSAARNSDKIRKRSLFLFKVAWYIETYSSHKPWKNSKDHYSALLTALSDISRGNSLM
jgi:hypothetical protein